MSDLVAGGNRAMPDGALSIRVPGPFDLSVIVTGEDGRTAGDGDFVFFNQPAAPGARLRADTLTVEPARLRRGAAKVTVVVSPAEPGTPLAALPVPVMTVTGPGGGTLARFTPPRPTRETALLLAELYRRGTGWKLRALGQGYADGLAGVARDFGIEVVEEDGAAPPAAGAPGGPGPGGSVPHGRTPRVPAPRTPASGTHTSATPASATPASATPASATPASGTPASATPASATPASGTHTSATPASHRPGSAEADGLLALVNAERSRTGARPVTADPRLSAAARAHAADMAAHGRLGRESTAGTSLFQRITAGGYAYLTLAEHLVSGPRTPAEFMDYCLRGTELRTPVGDPVFVHLGVGHAVHAGSGDAFWTVVWAEPFTRAGLERAVADVLALTNAERRAAGLRPLAADARLGTAAQAHSADMAGRGFYSHTTPEGGEPWDRAAAAGAAHRGIGENIACGQRTPAEVVRGWMDSPGHRANILKPDFTHLGVGYATGGSAGTYWTQLFGAAG
ncbi:CAP domain-containing protein [Streptomyces albireticuli]|uniref:Stress protein n=1 Tax=Streptomyces albireticuli TaxID=1940 RepID=A0A2A2D1C8_9ACTN|nr:CAP domain-containing protein [Streptomyces albireticuli]MCD9193496.1 CAP domain-containing protein [Streptomyces albireticuli]PAU45226.1 stress protein [Streptomyces albireticuli]